MRKKTDKKTIKLRNDIFYVCTVIERTARKIKHRNKYVVNKLGYDALDKLFTYADIYHSENQEEICDSLIKDFKMRKGNFDITDVNKELCDNPSSVNDMAKVYERLIWNTSIKNELVSNAIIRTYNNKICKIIDDYNGCAYYASSSTLTESYRNGRFE